MRDMKVKLIQLTENYYCQLADMIDEWKLDQIINHTNNSPRIIFKNDYHNFNNYIKNLELNELNEDNVPNSVFFLLDEERNILLGAINIRHYLNEYFFKYVGYIGYGIRPSERGKGYATEMLRLGLIECKKLEINKVLIVCYKSNIASSKVIIKNGGILENEFIDEDDKIRQRYWINVI